MNPEHIAALREVELMLLVADREEVRLSECCGADPKSPLVDHFGYCMTCGHEALFLKASECYGD